MTIREVTSLIEEIAPLYYAEDFDNVGLLVGDYAREVTGILVTLDSLEQIVEEAIEKDCNLIVSFHPIIFKGLTQLTGKNYVEKALLKAIKNDIAIYAIHTALDNSVVGVSAKMCEVFGLQNASILLPKTGSLKKLITYVPKDRTEDVREALFAAGAGSLGNYDACSFTVSGIGTFRGNQASNPAKGEKGTRHIEPEDCLQVVFEAHLEKDIVKTLYTHHPYEEVAFEIVTTDNINPFVGMGMIGEFAHPMEEDQFLQLAKKTFKTGCIRHSKKLGKKIQRVAVLGGSGSFAISKAIAERADAYISADFKYHDFFLAEEKVVLVDVGHYESEQFTKNLLVEYLTKKITSFAPALLSGKVLLSEKSTNPIYYL